MGYAVAFALVFLVTQAIQCFLPFYIIRIHLMSDVAPFAITLFESKAKLTNEVSQETRAAQVVVEGSREEKPLSNGKEG